MIDDFTTNTKQDKILNSAFNFVEFIVTKYEIKNYDDFKCPYVRALAESLEWFK